VQRERNDQNKKRKQLQENGKQQAFGMKKLALLLFRAEDGWSWK
jgi:hypothetical protein